MYIFSTINDHPTISYPSKSTTPKFKAFFYFVPQQIDKNKILFSIPHIQQFLLDFSYSYLYPERGLSGTPERTPLRTKVTHYPPFNPYFTRVFSFLFSQKRNSSAIFTKLVAFLLEIYFAHLQKTSKFHLSFYKNSSAQKYHCKFDISLL